jgi:hypothetical protein
MVLLIGGSNEVCGSDDFMWHDIRTMFYDNQFWNSSNSKVTTSTI